MDLAAIRNDYIRGQLSREDLLDDPIAQFDRWMKAAVEAHLPEPTAMSLATVGADGQPWLRTVLLKGLDERGFVFFTNLESRKSRQITENPRVSLLFPWLPLERQVIVTGAAEKLGTAEVLKYFLSRPRDSQLAAWASQQSRAVASREALETAWAQMKARFSGGEVPLPPFWGGYRIAPATVEFWQGRSSRLHDRFLYSRSAAGQWQIERLAP